MNSTDPSVTSREAISPGSICQAPDFSEQQQRECQTITVTIPASFKHSRLWGLAQHPLARGWRFSACHDKKGVKFWNRPEQADCSELYLYYLAKHFPEHNVCIVSSHGIGNLLFLDIDTDGVLERIERETGMTCPYTYTVQSRPKSKPWKQHIYFVQTQYCVSKFTREGQYAKDWTTCEPTHQYDLKGCGRCAFVVGAGSIHADDGETYTAVDVDAGVAEIPDAWVDWLYGDIGRSKQQERAYRKPINDVRVPDEKVKKSNIYAYLFWRVFLLARTGLEREDIEQCLQKLAIKNCENGKEFVEGHGAAIHRIAYNPQLQIAKPENGKKILIKPFQESRIRKATFMASQLPPQIDSASVYEAFAQHMPFDRKKRAVRPSVRPAEARTMMLCSPS
jgi:Bifunctional DNA primase/polymerase, N-terminal